jgi:hypothetical protein
VREEIDRIRPPTGAGSYDNTVLACRRFFAGLRAGAQTVWGTAGLDAIGRNLSEEARRATLDPLVIADAWLPTRFAMEWHEAAWRGPARMRAEEIERWTRARIDYGFGRVRRLMLSFVTPERFAGRAEELWRADHTAGEVQVKVTGKSAEARLRKHPFATNALTRLSQAEAVRYTLSLTNIGEVSKQFSLDGDTLVVRLSWTG